MHVPCLSKRPSNLVITLIVEEKKVSMQNLDDHNYQHSNSKTSHKRYGRELPSTHPPN